MVPQSNGFVVYRDPPLKRSRETDENQDPTSTSAKEENKDEVTSKQENAKDATKRDQKAKIPKPVGKEFKEFKHFLKDINQFDHNNNQVKIALADMEEKLFGLHRKELHEQRISDHTWIPIKSGIPGVKFLKRGPLHFLDAEDEEPLYEPQENILEDCLKREAERVGYNENLINKVVYDVVEDKNGVPFFKEEPNAESEENSPLLPTSTNCDNDADFPTWYQPANEKDTTLVFESRFESANLRKAIQITEFEYDLILKPDYLTKNHT